MAEMNAKGRDKLPNRKFAKPDKGAYQIEDKPHAHNTKARASQAVEAGRMSKAKEAKIEKRADPVQKV